MQLTLRRKPVGGYWRGQLGRLGQSGETETEGTGLPTDSTPDFNTQEYYESGYTGPGPGYNIETTPGVELTPTELAAEQTRARSWLSENFPSVLNTGTKALMSATQIAAGLQAGAVKTSSTCPSGYMIAGGACVQQQAGAPAAGQPLIPGLDNRSLAIIGAGLAFLLLLGGKRR
jgi:hypothetical protein